MKDFSIVTLAAVAWEFFVPWIWPLAILAAITILVYIAALLRIRSVAQIWRSGYFAAAVAAVLFGALMFAVTPMLTQSSWKFVSGIVDLIFIGLIALGFAVAMFVIALPFASLIRTKAAS